MQQHNSDDMRCIEIESLLSEYVDNTLPARSMWEVEKHLAECEECAETSRLTRELVLELRSSHQFDTSDQFMSRLHARLDDAGNVPLRRSPLTVVVEWFASVREQLNSRPIPTLSIGMASVLAVAVLVAVRPQVPTVTVTTGLQERVSQEALNRHVAVTASNPFDDPVAAKLEAETNASEIATKSGIE